MTRPAGQVTSQHIPRSTQGSAHFLPPLTPPPTHTQKNPPKKT